MKLKILSLLASIIIVPCFGQDYAKEVINELCSEKYFGRGYVKKGQEKAAKYIQKEFEKNNVNHLPNYGYHQYFKHSVNTFPGKNTISCKDTPLRPGIDFMVHPASGSGDYTARFDLFDQMGEGDRSIAYIPADYAEQLAKKGKLNNIIYGWAKVRPVVVGQKKLTWSVAPNAHENPVFLVIDSTIQQCNTLHLSAKNKVVEHESSNVVAWVKGTQEPDTFLLVTAHYDHVGGMDKTFIPGANDNAAGVALLLDLAKQFQQKPSKYSVLFIAFAGEEAGLIGSKYYTENPLVPLEKTKFVMNIDLVGTGSEGATVVNATVFEDHFAQLEAINKEQGVFEPLKKRGKAANSDHYWFTEKGIPSFFLYTMGGPPAYHDVNDKPETLPLTKYSELKKLLATFLNQL